MLRLPGNAGEAPAAELNGIAQFSCESGIEWAPIVVSRVVGIALWFVYALKGIPQNDYLPVG